MIATISRVFTSAPPTAFSLKRRYENINAKRTAARCRIGSARICPVHNPRQNPPIPKISMSSFDIDLFCKSSILRSNNIHKVMMNASADIKSR
jgi:hypothetical protein